MKKTAKWLSLFCAMVLAACLFSACGSEEKKYVVLEENLGTEDYSIGFRNGDIALGMAVQDILDDMIRDGKYAEISEKWFGEDLSNSEAPYLEEHDIPEGDDSLQKIKDKGTLILGLDDSFPPMGYRDADNQIVGFDIDLATEVANRLGVELVLQPIDWNSKEMELDGGKIDCIWNGLSVTDERLEAMFMPKAYIANTQIIIVPENSDIKAIADLEGKIIGLQEGSSSLDALSANPVKDKVAEIVEYPNNVNVYMDLEAGRIDAFVVDEVVGKYLIVNDGEEK